MTPASTYVLDTHALVWYLVDSPRLSLPAREALGHIDRGDSLGVVPTIVLAEIVHLADRAKISVNVQETIARLRQAPNFVIMSLDLAIVLDRTIDGATQDPGTSRPRDRSYGQVLRRYPDNSG